MLPFAYMVTSSDSLSDQSTSHTHPESKIWHGEGCLGHGAGGLGHPLSCAMHAPMELIGDSTFAIPGGCYMCTCSGGRLRDRTHSHRASMI